MNNHDPPFPPTPGHLHQYSRLSFPTTYILNYPWPPISIFTTPISQRPLAYSSLNIHDTPTNPPTITTTTRPFGLVPHYSRPTTTITLRPGSIRRLNEAPPIKAGDPPIPPSIPSNQPPSTAF
ncbi:hypothetical protein Pmani_034972 [Petrolisthes manimaculis]|uniref:Uncharacterized protein n=1 Tax=Petrolisthes manimaculis TaxID=1843537 RepID=A0AAE1NMM4_9EUCA|nr:hypothetical protein Pmani_034972 [Petrolisthes manimaculis]